MPLEGFEAFAHLREGFSMVLRGEAPDENGHPTGEHIEIEVIVPPPSLYMLKQLQAKQKAREGQATEDQFQSDVVDTIWLTLQRNYRGIPKWLIEQSLDAPLLIQLNEKMREMSRLSAEKKALGTSP